MLIKNAIIYFFAARRRTDNHGIHLVFKKKVEKTATMTKQL